MPDPEIQPGVSPPLLGRASEIAAALDHLKTHRGTLLGVKARSGMGKTRLLREINARASELNQNVFLIDCRGTMTRAFQPLASLVRLAMGLDSALPSDQQYEKLSSQLKDMKGYELIDPFSKLLNIRPGVAEPSPDSTFTDHHEGEDLEEVFSSAAPITLPDAMIALLAHLANIKPITVMFDDLDESGVSSSGVVFALAEKLKASEVLPVNLVCSYNVDAPEEFQSHFSEPVIQLNALPQDTCAELALKLSGASSLDEEFAKHVCNFSEGNPLFIATLIKSLEADKQLSINKDGALSGTSSDLPATFAALIEHRINQLSSELQETLKSSAVLGDGFRTGVMSALRGGGMQTAGIQAELAELVEKGWLETNGKGRQTSYHFPHRAIQNTIYEMVPEERRKVLHNHAGDYYTVVTGGQKLRTEQAVYHYVKAGNADRALPVIDMAASRASAVNNRERLVMLYRLAINVAQERPELENRQIEFAEKLGDQYAASGDYEKAAEAYTKYTPSMVPENLYNKLGVVLLAVDPARANNVLSRALTIIQAGQHDDVRWAMEASMCWGLCLTNNHYDALRRCRDALGRLGDTVGFGSARSLMRAILGMVLYYSGEHQEALPHLESARAGWGARNFSAGVMLINQVLIGMPKPDITKVWLKVILPIFMPGGSSPQF